MLVALTYQSTSQQDHTPVSQAPLQLQNVVKKNKAGRKESGRQGRPHFYQADANVIFQLSSASQSKAPSKVTDLFFKENSST